MRTRAFLIAVIIGLFVSWPAAIRAQEAQDAQATDPQAADPQAADPQAADPQAANPQAADPQAANPQAADPQAADPQAADPCPPRAVGFVEAMGGWGVQLGETPYLPDGSPTAYKYPLVTGWSAGATAGWLFAHDLAVIATYEYRSAWSLEGDIPGVLDRVQGEVRYHTVAVGVRLYRAVGPGRLRGEISAGLVLPFEVRLEYDYGPALAPAGIAGGGTRVDKYNLGYGAQGQVGYELPLGSHAYVALSLERRAFQSNNNGRWTRLDNVVTDFTARPPAATTATIDYGDGRARPIAYAVSDVTLQLAAGTRF